MIELWWLFATFGPNSAIPLVAAQTEVVEGDEDADSSEGDEEPVLKSPTKTRAKQRKHGQLEGTKARDRFEAVTVIKSRYQKNGKPLDIDPD